MKDHGPWKIKSSEVKYKSPWMEVREDAVITPDGKDGAYGSVIFSDGASALPIDDEGYVYLAEMFRYAIGHVSIEVPGGIVDPGEEPLQAAARELKEELGITANEFIPLGYMDPFTGSVKSGAHLFLARGLTTGLAEQEGDEQIKILKVKFEGAVQMVMDSKITHGQSCVLILKAAKYLGKL
jgi:8-oxo-dGTP pyrophosphatase MutT (NUDIX family)